MDREKVYLRYDPEDLRSVRVYDADEKYIMTVPLISDLMLDYGASKDEVRTAMQQKRRWRNQAKHLADIQREQAQRHNMGRLMSWISLSGRLTSITRTAVAIRWQYK